MAKRLIVVQKSDHSLGVYDLDDGRERSRIPLPPYPHEFVLSSDRRFAFQAHFGVALAEDEGPGGNEVSVVDLVGQRQVAALSCGAWRRPHGIAMDDAGALYVLSEAGSRLLIAKDPLNGSFDRDQPTGGEGSHMLSVTGDGRLAFASNMKTNDVSILFTDDPERPPVVIPVGARPEGSVMDGAEQFLYVVCRESAEIAVIDVARRQRLDSITTAQGPVRICWDRAGRLLVPLYHARALAVVEPASARTVLTVPLPGQPISIGYDTDADLALASTLDDQVCVIDLKAGRVARTIRTRPGPDPIAVLDL